MLGNDESKSTITSSTKLSTGTSKIKVNLPALFCAGREERVKVTAITEGVRQRIRVELTKKDQSWSDVVAITDDEKDESCLLLVMPKEEGEHLLSITVSGQHVPNSPFLLSVNNRDYYRSTFKQPVQTIDQRNPHSAAFSSDGDMFVTSTHTNSVHVYDKQGQKKNEIGKYGKGDLEFDCPRGIAIVEQVVFVSDSWNHRVQKFSTHGKFLGMFGSKGSGDGHLCHPQGLTIGPDGMIYVSDRDNDRIVAFSKVGAFVRNIDVSESVRCPAGLAISADGNIHVTEQSSHTYAVVSPAGQLVRTCEFREATDVAIDATGLVFAVGYCNKNNSLSIFGTEGEIIHTVQLDRPWGVAIAPDGSVWVAGWRRNKLWKF